ncbi:MAG: alkaline phosphatase family protein [Solirubrobacterales bacterium]|nr:alkaline phosphatase family protein [Solirubrobacterales bacterium]
MPRLLLGPLLRYVSDTDATIWVETDEPCEVRVLGGTAPTFCVAGHHYALVVLEDLEPGSVLPYTVELDGRHVWPEPDDPYPPCVIRTHAPERGEQLKLAFGSCRVSVPHDHPYSMRKDDDDRGREVDALLALVERMRHEPVATWPDALLLLGDQVYADEVSPGVAELIEERRPAGEGPPKEEVGDFEEYCALYRESWSDPALRWLLSTVSSAMIFDDHDVHDDWNTSRAWVEEMRAKDWWEERVVGAYMSYWIHQHVGNLSPDELREDPVWCGVHDGGDQEAEVREFARHAAREIAAARWSFRRDFGRTRLLVLDSRAGRVLEPGKRQMLSDGEWAWIREQVEGDYDHLLVGTSLPYLLAPGMHHLEAWNEAVCDGAWGKRAAKLGEKVRQGLDLEHWAAFQGCFKRMAELLEEVARGEHGPAPATIVLLSGDVHHAYLAEASFTSGPVESRVLQATCSPVRNPLDARERRALRTAFGRPMAAVTRRLARAAGVEPTPMNWAFAAAPTFDNQVAELRLEGRQAHLRIEKTLPEDWEAPKLHESLSLGIAPRGERVTVVAAR